MDPKPDTCTETVDVYAAGISGKVARNTLGGLPVCLQGCRLREGSGKGSRSQPRP